MIRSELVARIAEQNPHLYAQDVEAVVDAILDRVATALAEGDRVELRGFGTFSVRDHDARVGRNPRTGEVVRVEAKAEVHFKPGRAIQARPIMVRPAPSRSRSSSRERPDLLRHLRGTAV